MSDARQVMFDVRIQRRAVGKGWLTKKEIDQHLAKLPDVSAAADTLTIEQPAMTRRGSHDEPLRDFPRGRSAVPTLQPPRPVFDGASGSETRLDVSRTVSIFQNVPAARAAASSSKAVALTPVLSAPLARADEEDDEDDEDEEDVVAAPVRAPLAATPPVAAAGGDEDEDEDEDDEDDEDDDDDEDDEDEDED